MSIVLGAELGPEGGPDDDHLRAAAGVVLLLPLRAAADHHAPTGSRRWRRSAIPTICMILLFLLPFSTGAPERRPERRPLATGAGIFVIAAMAYLTYMGASAGPPTEIDLPTPQAVIQQGPQFTAEFNAGRAVAAQSGCLACHKIGDQRQRRPRAGADRDRRPPQVAGHRPNAHQPDRADAVVQEPAARQVQRARHLHLEPEVRAMSSGTLPEGQVRAMFDRIAGVYDLMNSVMTAGLHHRWRGRAVDLARIGAGARVLDVATGTGDLAIEAALTRRRGDRQRLLGGHARARPGEGARDHLRAGRRARPGLPRRRLRRRHRRLRGAQLRRSRAGPARDDPRRAARRAGRRAGDHARRSGLRCRPSSRCGSTASSRSSGARPATPTPTRTCPTRSSASPPRRGSAAAMARAGLSDIRWILTAGGIIAIHVGTA